MATFWNPAGQEVADFITDLGWRSDHLDPRTPRIDNPLKIATDGRNVSLDPRLAHLGPPGEEGRAAVVAREILRIHAYSKDNRYLDEFGAPHPTPGDTAPVGAMLTDGQQQPHRAVQAQHERSAGRVVAVPAVMRQPLDSTLRSRQGKARMMESSDNESGPITIDAGDVRGLRALLSNRQRQELR